MAEAGEWDVETKLVPTSNEQYRELRHLPEVVAHLQDLANRTAALTTTPDDYDIIVQNNPSTQRARALIHPNSKKAARRELAETPLIKAIAGMEGQ